MNGTRSLGRFFGGGDRAIASTVYGTVLAMAALAAGAVEHLSPDALITVVATTSGVIWLAHVYAHSLGESIERGHRLDWTEFSAIGGRELPILVAAAAPISVLLLGALGIVGETPDIWLAFGLGFVALALQERATRASSGSGVLVRPPSSPSTSHWEESWSC